MNSVRLNNLTLKYQRFLPSGCNDIRFRKVEFVAKTQFLYTKKFSLIILNCKENYIYYIKVIYDQIKKVYNV